MSNRKKATDFIVNMMKEIIPGDTFNSDLKKKQLNALSDEEFKKFMEDVRDGKEWITFYAPNLDTLKVDIDNNIRVGKMLGHNFFDRLWWVDPVTGRRTLSIHESFIVDIIVRRQSQLQSSKESIPLDNKARDDISGQVTSDSKGSKLSYPEVQTLLVQELECAIVEMIKFRGGDLEALREMELQIMQTGTADYDSLMQLGSRAKIIDVMGAYLEAMHLRHNL